ncbi:MAG TPA: AsmA family protein [Verrucomicrobiae bacterium]|nr:AsmA family protein [Verrucomicrobiae bacterium]
MPVLPTSPVPIKRRFRLRILLYGAVGLFLFLILAYFVVTSEAFFKGAVLPRISRAIGAEMTVADASVSPFSHISLKQVKIVGPGGEPFFEAADIRLDYSLMRILGGTLKVDNISVDSPSLTIVQNADGTLNVDPLRKGFNNAPGSPAPAPPQNSKPRRIELRNVAIKNAVVHCVFNLPGGGVRTVDVSGINVALDQLMNGQSGKFTASANAKISAPSNSVVEANASADVEFTLNQDLAPVSFKAKMDEQVSHAEGSFKYLAGFRSTFRGNVTPDEVKEISERVYRDDAVLGEVNLAGPLDLAKKEGRLTLTVGTINRQLLGLVGAAIGIDFGTTAFTSVSTITLKDSGSLVAIKAQGSATNLSINSNGHPTPPLNVTGDCDIALDLKNGSAQIQTLSLEGQQDQSSVLHGSLTQPMTVAWGNNAAPASDSVFELAVSNLNLPQWQALIGNAVSDGTFSMNFRLSSHQGGKLLDAIFKSHVAGLSAKLGGNGIPEGAVDCGLDAEISGLKKCTFTNCQFNLTEQGQPALQILASGSCEGTAFTAQSQVEAVIARLLGKGSATPLKVGATVSGSFAKNIFDLGQISISLPATERAVNNELHIKGQVDLSLPALTRGHFDVDADTLDLSPAYDAVTIQSEGTSPEIPQSSPAEATGNTEPVPVKFPFELTAGVSVKHAWLHEISMEDCQMTAKAGGDKLVLDPCSLTLNGGRVNGTVDVDFGVTGYRYSLGVALDKVPLEPIANSFSSDDAGRYKGLILSDVKITGAGVTGASLQKNLAGQVNFTLTNADIQLTGPKLQKVVGPIANLLGLHELLTYPLTSLDARIDMGGGNISISRCVVGSSAFEASVEGAIPIAEVLSNSPLNLPVQLSLRRSLALNVGLAPADTASNIAFVPVKNFVTIKGTIGEPASDVDKKALGGVFVSSGVGVARRLGGEASSGVKKAMSSFRNWFRTQSTDTNGAATGQ